MTILPDNMRTLPGRSKIYKRHSCRGITPSGKSSIQGKSISEVFYICIDEYCQEWEEPSPRVHFHSLITRITLQDSSWCPDSGATHHVTPDANNLANRNAYASTCWSLF
ncbi:hypothetical protein PanWU01x14_350560 [Parasponia andersonii]|uniref:Uncharacterized protein n=1 Tax=Parasponia andersonii TaxID=3476 RepID=A0A2P5AB01_PARAD|nr:hypothetical protein PanWU01x14_350560 [Parasponia andersonii]